MKAVYTITEIKENKIIASYEEFGITSSIKVLNPKRLPIKIGSKVYLGFPKKIEIIRGFTALFLPIALSSLALILSPSFAKILKVQPTEIFKMLCTLSAFLLSAIAILISSRNTHTIIQPQIISIEETNNI